MCVPPSLRLAAGLSAAVGLHLATSADLAAAPALELLPETLEFTAEEGQSGPVPQRTILVVNAGDGELAQIAAPKIVYGSASGWLEVVPGGSGNGQTLRNNVDVSGLSPRTYGATVEVASEGAAGSPRSYSVTLVVEGDPESQSGPVIEVSPARVDLEVELGDEGQAAAAMVRVTEQGGGALGAVETDVSYSQGTDWLTVSAAESGDDPQLRNTVSGLGLTVGTYTATVDVSVAGATNSPQSYVVFLTVTDPDSRPGGGGPADEPDGPAAGQDGEAAGPDGQAAGLDSPTLAGGCSMSVLGTARDIRLWPVVPWLLAVLLCLRFRAPRQQRDRIYKVGPSIR